MSYVLHSSGFTSEFGAFCFQQYLPPDIVHVKSTCSKPYSIKVIWAHETDSQCEYLPSVAGTMNSERNWPARFDGLAFC